MNKKIIAIIAINLFIFIGLCGCNELSLDNNDTKYISIHEILLHPNRYLNSTITTKGNYFGTVITEKEVIDIDNAMIIEILDDVNDPILINGAEYYFTGILKYRKSDYIYASNKNVLYLEVSKIEIV